MTRAPSDDYATTHPLRPLIAASVLTFLLFALSCIVIYVALGQWPAARSRGLLIYTGLFGMAWCAGTVVMGVRRPSPAERVRLWKHYAAAIIVGSHIACVALIWGVMPRVSTAAQLMIAIPLIGCIPTQIVCSPENPVATRSGILTVLGSLSLFLVTRDALLARLAAAYVVGFAAVMFVLSAVISRTVGETVRARLASEAAAERLDRMLGEVAAQRDAKTQFIASASHDLGQPLQAVALFFDQTLRAPSGAIREAAVEGVKTALASADRLLSHMLSHLRLEADAVVPYPSQVQLRGMLERVAASYRPSAEAAGMVLRVAAHAVTASLDPTLLERALGNLIHNAITHSRGRRVLLAARRRGADRVRIWVIDDGVGIERIDGKHIFDDYFQGARDLGAPRGGFGLGLASARRLALLMDGVAELEPRWRGGAAFYLEFPTVARAPASIGRQAPARRPAGALG